MLRRLYDWVMRLSASRHAPSSLFAVAFAESSFFPIPPDVMLAPMVLARPDRAWRYAILCTAGSILGGMLGYAIGYYLTDAAHALLAATGHGGGLEEFQCWYGKWGVWLILAKGLTPIPYKLVTIASGLAHFSFVMFILASVVTRAARYFMVAGVVKAFGPAMLPVIERRLGLFAALALALLIGGIVLGHFIGGGGGGAAC